MRRQLSQIVAVNQSQDKSFIHLGLGPTPRQTGSGDTDDYAEQRITFLMDQDTHF